MRERSGGPEATKLALAALMLVALIEALAVRLAFQGRGLERTAVRANRPGGPKLLFQMDAGRIGIVVNLGCDVEFHGSALSVSAI